MPIVQPDLREHQDARQVSIDGAIARGGKLHLLVSPAQAGMRLDRFLADALGAGRRVVARLAPCVRVDGRRRDMGRRVAAGEEVSIEIEADTDSAGSTGAPDRDAIVVVVKRDIVVLNKPAGLPTVSHALDRKRTLASSLARLFPECASVGPPGESGIVHRLDRETSGVMLAARSDAAYRDLREQFRGHTIEKRYLALVWGVVDRPLSIHLPIGQHRKSRRRVQAIVKPAAATRYAAHAATTEIEPLERLGRATLVGAITRTGRRHQVRVHLAAAGHPLLGDRLYGDREHDRSLTLSLPGSGHWLHAAALSWRTPSGSAIESVELPLPAEWGAVMRALSED